MMSRYTVVRAALVGIVVGLVALPARAQQVGDASLSYALRAGVNYSDNIGRAPAGFEQGVTGAAVGIDLNGGRDQGRLRYDLAANLMRFEFLDLDLSGQTFGRASASGELDLLPDVLWMNGSIAYDQLREDILRPIAIGNLVDQLTTSFGPTLHLDFGRVVDGQVDVRYSRSDFSRFFPDSETVGARAQLLRQSSPQSTIGLGVSYDDTSYAETPFFDFKRQEAFVRYETTRRRTDVQAEVGYANLDGNVADAGGAMIRARVSRWVAPSLRAHLSLVREYPTAQAISLGPVLTSPGGGAFDVSILTAAPRLSTVGEVGLTYQRTRTTIGVAYARRDEDALVAGIGSRNYAEYRMNLRREMTPRSRLSLQVVYMTDVFQALSLDAKELVVGAELAFDVGRSLGIDVRAEHRTRDGNFAGEFTETNFGVYLRYSGRSARLR